MENGGGRSWSEETEVDDGNRIEETPRGVFRG